MKSIVIPCALLALKAVSAEQSDQHSEALRIANEIVQQSKQCFEGHSRDKSAYEGCVATFCAGQCGQGNSGCGDLCQRKAAALFQKLSARGADARKRVTAQLQLQAQEAADEQAAAMSELLNAQDKMVKLNHKISDRAAEELHRGEAAKGQKDLAKAKQLANLQEQIKEHLSKVQQFHGLVEAKESESRGGASFLQLKKKASPEDALASEMTHDLEMNFNKIAPFGKEDTAKELQDHAANTQNTLVDAVENAEVAEIKRAVFRALTRLRAATIKEFDTIARLETQAIDAYNDAHHYRAENPLAHLHEDEAPVETDKLKSFH